MPPLIHFPAKFITLLSVLLIAGCTPPRRDITTNPEINSAELRRHVQYLASPEMGGRRSGEEGNRRAAAYIASQFKRYGLQPVGDHGSYYQSFEFVSGLRQGPRNTLTITVNNTTRTYERDVQYRPLSFTADTSITAPLVFAGYGISADSVGYDDYKDIHVDRKVVVVLRFSPEGDQTEKFSAHIPLYAKASVARERGAVGILFLGTPPDKTGETLIHFQYPANVTAAIPAATLRWSDFEALLRRTGKDLASIHKRIDSTTQPSSFDVPDATVSLSTEIIRVRSRTANVIGLLEGSDPSLQDEAIVIGAHFDHIGKGGPGSGSLKPDTSAVHHGADDNGSGTAGLLELAEFFSSQRESVRRSLIFIAFSGEEMGLLGSNYYVKNPLRPLEKTAAMINMDMIGRMRDSILVVEGMGTSPTFEELATTANAAFGLNVKLKPDGFGPSDHSSFYMRDVPVMFFFTNLHEDYHRPSDTWEKINYAGQETIVRYIASLATVLANNDTRPAFTKAPTTAALGGGDRREVRVSLGIVPDYADEETGLKISGTRPGSAAERAGLLAEDLIIRFDDQEIRNIYDLMGVLGKYKPGDAVVIVVKRAGEEVSLTATLEARK